MNLHTLTLHALREHGIFFREYIHDPILSYEDAEREKGIHNWKGVESKNVFLTDKKGGYYLFLTYQGVKVDFQKMLEITGKKLSIASKEEVIIESKCLPGCVSPFLFDEKIMSIVDMSILDFDFYLFSPGIATSTLEVSTKDVFLLLQKQKNTFFL